MRIAIALFALSLPVFAQAGQTAPGTTATEQDGAAKSMKKAGEKQTKKKKAPRKTGKPADDTATTPPPK
ncbi:MAG TPA: hypothetical protein VH083_10435 [Myxococcales bacterium]|jgi:hypothetical protein|nr:hypothetical protein [Myxococcales bacterium]